MGSVCSSDAPVPKDALAPVPLKTEEKKQSPRDPALVPELPGSIATKQGLVSIFDSVPLAKSIVAVIRAIREQFKAYEQRLDAIKDLNAYLAYIENWITNPVYVDKAKVSEAIFEPLLKDLQDAETELSDLLKNPDNFITKAANWVMSKQHVERIQRRHISIQHNVQIIHTALGVQVLVKVDTLDAKLDTLISSKSSTADQERFAALDKLKQRYDQLKHSHLSVLRTYFGEVHETDEEKQARAFAEAATKLLKTVWRDHDNHEFKLIDFKHFVDALDQFYDELYVAVTRHSVSLDELQNTVGVSGSRIGAYLLVSLPVHRAYYHSFVDKNYKIDPNKRYDASKDQRFVKWNAYLSGRFSGQSTVDSAYPSIHGFTTAHLADHVRAVCENIDQINAVPHEAATA